MVIFPFCKVAAWNNAERKDCNVTIFNPGAATANRCLPERYAGQQSLPWLH